MRNGPKPAVKALFAAIEAAKEDARERTPLSKFPAEPPPGRAIEIDPLWLSSMGFKGRA